MKVQDAFNRVGNPILSALLRSPLYALAGSGTALITVTGRRSGRTYATPVNVLTDGDRLTIVSLRERTWWRNLRQGAEVGLRLHGQDRRGQAAVVEDASQVAAALAEVVRRLPAYARFFGLRRRPDGAWEDDGLRRAAQGRVIVNVELL
jgi:deazaflavin-dependent oxidoreductase (nitroreductase family)